MAVAPSGEQPGGVAQPAVAGSSLRVQLLGDVVVELDGHPVADFESARLQRLLAWLVLHADRAQRRAGLAFTFWPDSTESQARTNLRHLLHDLRQAVPVVEQFVEITPAALSWRTDTRRRRRRRRVLRRHRPGGTRHRSSRARVRLSKMLSGTTAVHSCRSCTTTGCWRSGTVCTAMRSTRCTASGISPRTRGRTRRRSGTRGCC